MPPPQHTRQQQLTSVMDNKIKEGEDQHDNAREEKRHAATNVGPAAVGAFHPAPDEHTSETRHNSQPHIHHNGSGEQRAA